jgi:threonylcarbamoyladenosine tRNA methylthiotransferase MtaB
LNSTAQVVNIGCRLNQSEGDSLRRYLIRQGYELVPPDPEAAPDLVIVNTCCVTRAAERSSVNRLRRAAALRSQPRVVATGCLAELDPDRLASLPGVTEVWNIADKLHRVGTLAPLPERSRAFLKVQDGCDNGCAFCIVHQLRSRPRSKPVRAVLAELKELARAGFAEVVLVGLNLGRYGEDTGSSLNELLARLGDMTRIASNRDRVSTLRPAPLRIRLGSLEPDTVTPALIATMSEMMTGSLMLCPHLHIPLQSGDDAVLAAMNRRYRTAEFRQLVTTLVRRIPDINIGTDVITGFPGEGATAHEHTRELLASLPVGYLHVFSYSPRPGTPAGPRDRIPPKVKQARTRELRALSLRKALAYRQSFVGKTRPGVLLAGTCPAQALTDNYINVRLDSATDIAGVVRVCIRHVTPFGACGSLIDSSPTDSA